MVIFHPLAEIQTGYVSNWNKNHQLTSRIRAKDAVFTFKGFDLKSKFDQNHHSTRKPPKEHMGKKLEMIQTGKLVGVFCCLLHTE